MYFETKNVFQSLVLFTFVFKQDKPIENAHTDTQFLMNKKNNEDKNLLIKTVEEHNLLLIKEPGVCIKKRLEI